MVSMRKRWFLDVQNGSWFWIIKFECSEIECLNFNARALKVYHVLISVLCQDYACAIGFFVARMVVEKFVISWV